jgi:DNA-binding NarL/FixJ family response regulator
MKIQILVIGRHEEILNTLLRIINKNEDWSAQGTLSDREAIKLFDTNNFDIVLLSSGISINCEDSLCCYFKDKKPDIKIIQHYGGGSGLLSNEIMQALNGQHALQHNRV